MTKKEVGGVKLHPATFGLISWLTDIRKNPAVCGKGFGMLDVAELCYAFSRPSAEIEALSASELKVEVKAFMHEMTPELFARCQKHAEVELLKYFDTITTPKKKPARKRAKAKR